MALDAHLVELSEKHRQLDRKIEEEMARPTADDLKISELKLSSPFLQIFSN